MGDPPISRSNGNDLLTLGVDFGEKRERAPMINFRLPSKPLSLLLSVVAFSLLACTPRVEVLPPSEPITINLNVKIDHEVRVKVEKDLDQVLSKDSKLF